MSVFVQVLAETQDTSQEGTGGSGRQFAVIGSHAGGTWILQYENPDDEWEDTDITFTDNGIKDFWSNFGTRYRLSGGTRGAKGWITGVFDLS